MVHTLGVIPARIGSTRFPRKVLFPLRGKPMIQHVWENCRLSRLDRCVVATDDHEVYKVVTSAGGECVITEGEFASGTDRVAHVARGIAADVVINIQADEPTLNACAINQLIDVFDAEPQTQMATLYTPVDVSRFGHDPNIVKVFLDDQGRARSFSRELPPDYGLLTFHKHIGVYAFRRETLFRYCTLPMTSSEKAARLEQLRALDNGIPIRVVQTNRDTLSVDTPRDAVRADQFLKELT